jgi:predicted enzyme related to lactoylglutathione lyase
MSNNPVVHFEMPYEDAERLQAFYRSAFGWHRVQVSRGKLRRPDRDPRCQAGTLLRQEAMGVRSEGD